MEVPDIGFLELHHGEQSTVIKHVLSKASHEFVGVGPLHLQWLFGPSSNRSHVHDPNAGSVRWCGQLLGETVVERGFKWEVDREGSKVVVLARAEAGEQHSGEASGG